MYENVAIGACCVHIRQEKAVGHTRKVFIITPAAKRLPTAKIRGRRKATCCGRYCSVSSQTGCAPRARKPAGQEPTPHATPQRGAPFAPLLRQAGERGRGGGGVVVVAGNVLQRTRSSSPKSFVFPSFFYAISLQTRRRFHAEIPNLQPITQ